ncbi:hypothetical protein PL321_10155 [Caloramator sp. mosi_1]|uniref:hypothetical protein n=1 Tax=Caloramator sp. mosi_1 TaxID=3023090 RepID=UPI0023629AC3|nr:hypothetical protein [Caloramator sp. mosi_1]WDC83182.1 hypothetical protein PL321_10155 [Caloramator sp. mosi_1]
MRYVNRVNNVAIKTLILGCLSFIELINGNFKKAMKYLEESKILIDKVHSNYIWSYYLSMALINFLTNNEKEFKNYLDILKNSNDKLPINKEINVFYNIYIPEYYINNIEKLNQNFKFSICLLLCEKEFNDYANKIFEKIINEQKDSINLVAKVQLIKYF